MDPIALKIPVYLTPSVSGHSTIHTATVPFTSAVVSSEGNAEDANQQRVTNNKLYILQYPLNPLDRPLSTTTDANNTPARIKPNVDILQSQTPLDPQSIHYNKRKGALLRQGLDMAYSAEQQYFNATARREKIAANLSLQSKQCKTEPGTNNSSSAPLIDASTAADVESEKNRWISGGVPIDFQRVLSGQSSSGKICVAHFNDGKMYLTPIDAILQGRANLIHLDVSEQAKQKVLNNSNNNGMESSEESGGASEMEEATLAASAKMTLQKKQEAASKTMSRRQLLQKAIEEEDWVPLESKTAAEEIERLRQSLFVTGGEQQSQVHSTLKPQEYLMQLGDRKTSTTDSNIL